MYKRGGKGCVDVYAMTELPPTQGRIAWYIDR